MGNDTDQQMRRVTDLAIRLAALTLLIGWCAVVLLPFLLPITWGVIIAAGPNIAPHAGDALAPPDRSQPLGHAFDVLPTLLALQGVPLGQDFVGKPMTGVLDAGFLESVPVRTVRTHDDRAWDEARRARIKEAADRAERLEQLRSLGYIK